METSELRGGPNIFLLLKIILPGLLFGSLCFKLYDPITNELTIAVIVTGIFAFLAIVALLLHDYPIVKDGQLIIKSIFGYIKKKISLGEIDNFISYETGSRYTQWNNLKLFSAKHDYTYVISEQAHLQYKQFYKLIANSKPYNYEAEEKLQRKTISTLAIVGILFGLLITAFFSWILMARDRGAHDDNWALITFILIGVTLFGYSLKTLIKK